METRLCLLLLAFTLCAVEAADLNLTMLVCSWNPPQVVRVSHFGANGISTVIASSPRPVAIDFDTRDRMVYWTDVSLRRLSKMDLFGNNRRTVLTLNSKAVPDGLAVDSGTRQMFYTDTGNDVIAVMSLNGGTPRIILGKSNGLVEPRAIILHSRYRRIYFTDWGRYPYIASASYTGSGLRKIVTTRLKWPNGLTLDRRRNILYFCDAGTDKIEAVYTSGSGRRVLRSEPGAHFFDITHYNNRLYFTGWRRGGIVGMTTGGSAVSFISTKSLNKTVGLHLIPENTPVLPPTTSPPVTSPPVTFVSPPPFNTLPAPSSVPTILLCSWNPGALLRVSKPGTSWTVVKIATLPRPVAVDYNPRDRMVYYTDVVLKQIGRIDLKGNNKQILLRLNSSAVPDGLAVDGAANKLFYTDTGNDVISVLDLRTGQQNIILRRSNGLDEPRAIILDTRYKQIYWTDWGKNAYIARASYYGTGLRKIVTSGLQWPNGLTLDRSMNKLYFCDAKNDKIESVSTSGAGRLQILKEKDAHYFDITYYNKTLYFTGWKRHGIRQMPRHGGAVSIITDPLINQPAGLHLITQTGNCPCPKCKEIKRARVVRKYTTRVSYRQKYTVSCGSWWSRRRCVRYRTAWRYATKYRSWWVTGPTGLCVTGCVC